MHPFYLSDFIDQMNKELSNNMEFLIQGLHTTYKYSSPRVNTDIHWQMGEIVRTQEELKQKLKELVKLIEKANNNSANKQV